MVLCNASLTRLDRGARSENAGQIIYNEHLTLINTFLLGIDPQIFNDAIQDPFVQERINVLEDKFKDTTVMIGIDRLDHTKRMTQKLQGYDYFLDEHAELKGRVTLVQVAIPSQDYGDDYQELEMDIGSLARKINEKHGMSNTCLLITLFSDNCRHAQLVTTHLHAPLLHFHRVNRPVLHLRHLHACIPERWNEPRGY